MGAAGATEQAGSSAKQMNPYAKMRGWQPKEDVSEQIRQACDFAVEYVLG
jgi:hypothetical protein